MAKSESDGKYQYPGLLTQGERKWLAGEKEVSDQYERKMKSRILGKFEGMVTDVSLMSDKYPPEKLEQAFRPRYSDSGKLNGKGAIVDGEAVKNLFEMLSALARALGGEDYEKGVGAILDVATTGAKKPSNGRVEKQAKKIINMSTTLFSEEQWAWVKQEIDEQFEG